MDVLRQRIFALMAAVTLGTFAALVAAYELLSDIAAKAGRTRPLALQR